MNAVVMKNIFPLRYEIRYIIDCWNLDVIIVPVGEKKSISPKIPLLLLLFFLF